MIFFYLRRGNDWFESIAAWLGACVSKWLMKHIIRYPIRCIWAFRFNHTLSLWEIINVCRKIFISESELWQRCPATVFTAQRWIWLELIWIRALPETIPWNPATVNLITCLLPETQMNVLQWKRWINSDWCMNQQFHGCLFHDVNRYLR